jgi:hypothetical protein
MQNYELGRGKGGEEGEEEGEERGKGKLIEEGQK